MILNFEADVHMHTIMSGHAYGTIREMAQTAAEKGLKTIGLLTVSNNMIESILIYKYIDLCY